MSSRCCERLHLAVLAGVVEPARADRDVALGRIPDQLLGADEILAVAEVAGRLVAAAVLGQHAPFALAGQPVFVAHPADVGPHAEDHGLGLQLADDLDVAVPVVDLPLAVGPFAAGAVPPDLGDLAVVGQQLAELVLVVVVVGVGAVGLLVAVPGREIDAELEARLAAGVGHLLDHVALAAAPRAVLHAVLGVLARPEAEAVVVLAGEDEQLHAGLLAGRGPLVGVEGRGIEELRVFLALAPLAVGEGVHAEVGEAGELQLLPGESAAAWA